MGTPRRLRPCLCLVAVLAFGPASPGPGAGEGRRPSAGGHRGRSDRRRGHGQGPSPEGRPRTRATSPSSRTVYPRSSSSSRRTPVRWRPRPLLVASSPSTPAANEPAASPRPPRFVVLAVDDVHVQFANMVRVQKALTRFIDEDIGPEDRVALVTTSGTQGASQEFTSDRGLLRRAISRLSAKDRRVEWVNVPRITEYQAELIERGDPDALWLAEMDILCDHPDRARRAGGEAEGARGAIGSRRQLEADPGDARTSHPGPGQPARPKGDLPPLRRVPDRSFRPRWRRLRHSPCHRREHQGRCRHLLARDTRPEYRTWQERIREARFPIRRRST